VSQVAVATWNPLVVRCEKCKNKPTSRHRREAVVSQRRTFKGIDEGCGKFENKATTQSAMLQKQTHFRRGLDYLNEPTDARISPHQKRQNKATKPLSLLLIRLLFP